VTRLEPVHLPAVGLSRQFRAVLQRRCEDGLTGIVADLDALDARYAAASTAAAEHGVHLLCAVKASTQPEVLGLAAAHGLGFDVANGEEIARVRAVAPGAMMSLTSPALPIGEREPLFAAFATGEIQRWHCDSLAQLEELCAACPGSTVGVRVNLDGLAAPYDMPLWRPSRFGIQLDQLSAAREVAAVHGCALRWLHTHNGSEENDLASYVFAAEQIVAAARHHRIDLASLDLGGGVFVDPTAPAISRFLDPIRRVAAGIELVLEPGRWWLTDCVSLVTRVLGIKETPDFVALLLDFGLMSHLQWSDYLRIPTLGPLVPGDPRPWRICGRTCFEEDWLDASEKVPVSADGPVPQVGEYFVLGNVSGYSVELSCAFNGVARQTMATVRPHEEPAPIRT
jgi:diaminopimelate decarboxylase